MFHWHRYQAIESVTKDRRVLEIGCGSGYGASFLAKSAASVVALDVDPTVIDEARNKYASSNLIYQQGSGLEIPYPDASFDVVVSFEMIEHIERSEHKLLIQEIRRVMTPQGILAISTPDHERTVTMGADNPYHIGEVSAQELETLLNQYFPVVSMYYQDISAASVLWGAMPTTGPVQGFAVALTPDGSTPTPVELTSHLPIVALASGSPIPLNLTGFCTETSRRLLLNLWDDVAEKTRLLRENTIRLSKVEETLSRLTAQHEALWRENHKMATVILEAEQIREEYNQWRIERPGLLEAQAQWNMVSSSRAWRRLKRYWSWLDHSHTGRAILWVKNHVARRPRP